MVETILTAHTDNRDVVVCSKCNGTGYVSDGIYNRTANHQVYISGEKLCSACNGRGYVWV